MFTQLEGMTSCDVSTRFDTVHNVFAVTVSSTVAGIYCGRQYFFNIPADAASRGAQVFETCTGEALIRHEAWVSGNEQTFAVGAPSSAALVTPTPAAPTTPPAASPTPAKRAAAAPAPVAPEATPPAAGPAKKKGAATPVVPPAPVEVAFTKSNECKKAYSEVMTGKLGANWSKNEDYMTESKGICKKLEEEGVICLRDGVVVQEFKDRVVAELEEIYSFE